jgi:hypothetical protein
LQKSDGKCNFQPTFWISVRLFGFPDRFSKSQPTFEISGQLYRNPAGNLKSRLTFAKDAPTSAISRNFADIRHLTLATLTFDAAQDTLTGTFVSEIKDESDRVVFRATGDFSATRITV